MGRRYRLNKRKNLNISGNIAEYLKERSSEERYASFDYCYNYFQSFYENGDIKAIAFVENIQLSCLELGFFLASWSMFRGSSFLIEKILNILRKLYK